MKKGYLFVMMFLALALSVYAQADAVESGELPGIVALVAAVAVVTQFIKTAINNSNFGFLKRIIIEKWAAVVLAILVSLGVVLYFALTTGTPLNLALLILAGEVAIAATMGYSILKPKK